MGSDLVKRRDIISAKKMIQKIRSNKTYPVDKLNRYENKLNKWLKEFEDSLKVIEISNYKDVFIHSLFDFNS